MKYVSAGLMALAAAAHCAALANALGVGVAIGVGVLAALFAVEGMITEAFRALDDTHNSKPLPGLPTDAELRRPKRLRRPF